MNCLGGQFQGTGTALELDHVLHAPLPPGSLTNDDRAFVVLEAGAEDFAGRRAEVVDKNSHREAGVGAGLGGVPDPFTNVSSLGTDDAAFFNEHVGDPRGLAEQSAGVVTQVDDQRLHALLFQLLQGGVEFVGGPTCEVCEPDVTDFLLVIEHEVPLVVVAEDVPHDGWHLDDGSCDGDLDHFLDSGAADSDRDGIAGLALHQRDGGLKFLPLGERGRQFAVDLDNLIASLDSLLVGGAAGRR